MNQILKHPPGLSIEEQRVVADAYGRALVIQDEMILLLDLALDFTRCNPKVRDILATAVFLAAGPSSELESLFWWARRCWREAEADVRKLEQMHGGALPPDHRADFPLPSFALKTRAA